jgi:predicted transcriptional regulator
VGKKPALVIIDTFARSAVGIDENSAQAVGQFIAAVDNIIKALECAALVVHHTGKDGLMRGSSSLYSAADAVLSQNINDGVIRLTNNPDFGGKNKYSAAEYDEFFRIVPHAAGGFDGGVLVPSERIESSSESNKLTKNQRIILETLEGYADGLGATAIIDASEISKTTVYRSLTVLMKSGHVSYANELYTITELGKEALDGES